MRDRGKRCARGVRGVKDPGGRPFSSTDVAPPPTILILPYRPAALSAAGSPSTKGASHATTYLIDGSFCRAETIAETAWPLSTCGMVALRSVTEQPLQLAFTVASKESENCLSGAKSSARNDSARPTPFESTMNQFARILP